MWILVILMWFLVGTGESPPYINKIPTKSPFCMVVVLDWNVGIGSDPRPPPWDKIPTFTENFWNRHQDIRQTWNRTDISRVYLKQDKLRKDRWRKSLNHMQVPTVLPSSLVTLYYRLQENIHKILKQNLFLHDFC